MRARTISGVAWTMAGALMLIASVASAQPVDDASRRAARNLAVEGDALLEKADYAAALDRFARAEALVRAPTMTLRAAECLIKLGRLVEASEKLGAITRMDLADDAPRAFKDAQVTAETQLTALRARVPSLEIKLLGSGASNAEVTVDGKKVPPALLGVKYPVDPGSHAVRAAQGKVVAEQTITAREGAAFTVELRLEAPASEPVVALPEKPQPEKPPVQAAAKDKTLVWVSLGVGAAGLVVGGVTGAMALGKKSSLDGACSDGRCPPSTRDDLDGYNGLTTVSTIGFAVALIGGGVGATLLLTSKDAPAAPAMSAWVGPGAVGISGRY